MTWWQVTRICSTSKLPTSPYLFSAVLAMCAVSLVEWLYVIGPALSDIKWLDLTLRVLWVVVPLLQFKCAFTDPGFIEPPAVPQPPPQTSDPALIRR